MKRIYITPITRTLNCHPVTFCANSPTGTGTDWQTGTQGQNPENYEDVGGGSETPDPNKDSRYLRSGIWDE